jgi:hypothetical protein
MGNLETALSEINRMEAILRSRYHYEHPIFGHLAIARECVEAELAAAAPPAPQPEVTSGLAQAVEEESVSVEFEPISEGQPPARRARKVR